MSGDKKISVLVSLAKVQIYDGKYSGSQLHTPHLEGHDNIKLEQVKKKTARGDRTPPHRVLDNKPAEILMDRTYANFPLNRYL
jgi:hypothetical protein